MMIVHMVMHTVCIWAYDAHAAMQVSNPEGYASTYYFCWPESEFQVNAILRLRKMDCHGVSITDQDTSAHLVAQRMAVAHMRP